MSKYIGYKGISNEGCAFEVVGRGSQPNYFTVRFENGYESEFFCGNISRGTIKNPYHPSVCGVGYFGVGDFDTKTNGKQTKQYYIWTAMLQRCYDFANQEKHPTYKGCSVAEEWHCFQSFAYWLTNHRNWGKGYQLDKDLKICGNKVYSPETCDLIPQAINSLLTDRGAARGSYAVGVCWDGSRNKYKAQCGLITNNGLSFGKNLGRFDTEQEAFFAYKKAKEENIKKVAEYYKSEICIEIYNNLMNYEVPAPEFREENTI